MCGMGGLMYHTTHNPQLGSTNTADIGIMSGLLENIPVFTSRLVGLRNPTQESKRKKQKGNGDRHTWSKESRYLEHIYCVGLCTTIPDIIRNYGRLIPRILGLCQV
jgi:hypothetical protein